MEPALDDSGDKRQCYTRRLAALKQERQSFIDHWRDISDNILPRKGRFLLADRNKGNKRNSNIIDNTGTLALRTLASGLMSGVTSPARPWFRLATPDPRLMEVEAVKVWLADVERLMREVFNRSNVYNALFSVYEEIGAFGSAAMVVYEHPDTGIACETLTAGEYYLANNSYGHVDTLFREYSMTVAQVVEEFGRQGNGKIDWSGISAAVKGLYDAKALDSWVECIHAIQPNTERKYGSKAAKDKAWSSVWYESGGDPGKLLRESGFDEFPAMCPRWNLAGADIYGRSPAMDALGDVRQLQVMEKRLAQAIDKMVNPPLQSPTAMMKAQINSLPGGVNFVDAQTPGGGIRSLYDVQPRTVELQQSMDFVRQRINRAFYADLWMIVTEIERSNVTATEIDARREEKLLMLGPVLERLHHELLDPLIDRTFAIMLKNGEIPPPPDELSGNLRVEYISMLAQAQRSVAVSGIERLVGFVGQMAQTKPDALDKIDFDQAIDEYGEALGTSARIIVSDDKVAELRAARAKQQQAQAQQAQMAQMAQTAQVGTQAAANLGGIPSQGGSSNVMQDLLGGIMGGLPNVRRSHTS
jgi:hypothetical protein